MRHTIAALKCWAINRLAANYSAGPNLADALRVCRKIAANGWSTTICPWDGPQDTPEAVGSSYHLALKAIAEGKFDSYLSVKVPALHYNFERVRGLLEEAGEYGIRIHLDSHESDSASRTLDLLEKGSRIYRNVSCTLPSRWRRSITDAERAMDLRVAVRVVKGQWPDPKDPNRDPTASFLDLIDVLRGRATNVGVATHDASLATEALKRLRRSETPCELEQLYGLPFLGLSVANRLGVRARIYVAYGNAWLPYCISQVGRRPIILAWLARDLLQGNPRFR